MLDENLHGGVHYGEREKIRAVTRPLLLQFRRILDRGASQRVFAANIDVEKFFAAAFSLTTTCFLTGRVMSEYLPIDLQSSAGMSDWEEYAINLLFASIDRKSVVEGKRVSVRIDLGGRRIIQKQNNTEDRTTHREKKQKTIP